MSAAIGISPAWGRRNGVQSRTRLLREESNMKIKTNIRAGLIRVGGGRRGGGPVRLVA